MTPADRFRRLTQHPEGDSVKSRSLRGGVYAMMAEGSDFVLRVGSMAILARLLVPEHFGLLGMVTAVTAIAERFKDLGLSIATIQQKEITHEQVSTLFWINAGVGLLFAGLGAALSPLMAVFFNDARLVPTTIATASTFFWSGLAIQYQALLRRQMKFAHTAAIQIAASALSIVIAIIFAANGAGYWALVVRELARNLLTAAGAVICFPWIPSLPSRGAGVRRMLRMGTHVSGFNLVWFLSSSLDMILIGRLFGAASLGVYRQGFQLVLAPINQLVFPVRYIAESALSRLQDDPQQYRLFFRRLLGGLSTVTMPLVAFLAVYADAVVLSVLGEKWEAATPIFRTMAIAAFIRPAMSTVSLVMLTCGHSKRYFWSGIFGAFTLVFSFIAIVWMFPESGAAGIAWAHVAASYTMAIPNLLWSLRDVPVNLRTVGAAIVRPVVASLTMVGALLALRQAALTQHVAATLALGAATMLAGYFGIWCLLPGGRAELRLMVTGFFGQFSALKILREKARSP